MVVVALQEHGELSLCAASASSGHAPVSDNDVIRQLSSPAVWCCVHLWNHSQNTVTACWQVKPPPLDVFPYPHNKVQLTVTPWLWRTKCIELLILSAWQGWLGLFVAPDKSWEKCKELKMVWPVPQKVNCAGLLIGKESQAVSSWPGARVNQGAMDRGVVRGVWECSSSSTIQSSCLWLCYSKAAYFAKELHCCVLQNSVKLAFVLPPVVINKSYVSILPVLYSYHTKLLMVTRQWEQQAERRED